MKQYLFLATLLATASANAGLIKGEATGSFSNPTPTGSSVVYNLSSHDGVDDARIDWGSPTRNNGRVNFLEFDKNNTNADSFNKNPSKAFTFGRMTYRNEETALGTTITAIDLLVDFDFTSPNGIANTQSLFNLDISSTTNQGNSTADTVTFNVSNSVTNAFNYAGNLYTLVFLGLRENDRDASLSNNKLTLALDESRSADFFLRGRFDVTPVSAVPVPAALPLMASALGMFGIARRRKNQA